MEPSRGFALTAPKEEEPEEMDSEEREPPPLVLTDNNQAAQPVAPKEEPEPQMNIYERALHVFFDMPLETIREHARLYRRQQEDFNRLDSRVGWGTTPVHHPRQNGVPVLNTVQNNGLCSSSNFQGVRSSPTSPNVLDNLLLASLNRGRDGAHSPTGSAFHYPMPVVRNDTQILMNHQQLPYAESSQWYMAHQQLMNLAPQNQFGNMMNYPQLQFNQPQHNIVMQPQWWPWQQPQAQPVAPVVENRACPDIERPGSPWYMDYVRSVADAVIAQEDAENSDDSDDEEEEEENDEEDEDMPPEYHAAVKTGNLLDKALNLLHKADLIEKDNEILAICDSLELKIQKVNERIDAMEDE
uniref:DUF1421 domain-containing protein n=1 Tax=Caenorhabditis tropicalis TaxID=1561998 RepID=A0A1I7TR96_9PELO